MVICFSVFIAHNFLFPDFLFDALFSQGGQVACDALRSALIINDSKQADLL